MKKPLKILIFGLFLFLLSPSKIQAYFTCSYQSTQARVQANIHDPWKNSITVGCEKRFNVGSFHDGTGQFANDTILRVTGPYGFNKYFSNGKTVNVSHQGQYLLHVTTKNQFGSACEQTATARVFCNEHISYNYYPYYQYDYQRFSICSYRNTQARVQKDKKDPWKSRIYIYKGENFNVGSFHDGTGQFANNTTLCVIDPHGRRECHYRNGDRLKAGFKGTYRLEVKTNNQDGWRCEDIATIVVESKPQPIPTPRPWPRPWPTPDPYPTPYPTPQPPALKRCQYTSTEARVQEEGSGELRRRIELQCGQSFKVFSFHNGSQDLANDTTLELIDPDGISRFVQNGELVRAEKGGIYRLKVRTIDYFGDACCEDAFVKVICLCDPSGC